MTETCTSTTAQEHSFLWDDGGDSHNNWQGKENLPHMCAYKNIGQEESILLLLFLPDGVLWSCLHAVSASELSVFLRTELFQHLSYQLTSSSSSLQGIAEQAQSLLLLRSSVVLRTELFQSLSYQLTLSSSSLQGIARASSVSTLASFVSCSQDGAVEPPLLCATSLTRGEP